MSHHILDIFIDSNVCCAFIIESMQMFAKLQISYQVSVTYFAKPLFTKMQKLSLLNDCRQIQLTEQVATSISMPVCLYHLHLLKLSTMIFQDSLDFWWCSTKVLTTIHHDWKKQHESHYKSSILTNKYKKVTVSIHCWMMINSHQSIVTPLVSVWCLALANVSSETIYNYFGRVSLYAQLTLISICF